MKNTFKTKSKIVFIHLLNDYSGSPLVLSNVIKGMQQKGHQCDVITSANNDGFLTGIDNVSYNFFDYKWNENKFLRLIIYLWSQVVVFFKILKYRNQNAIIYVNTFLSFGASLGAKLIRKKVIYHIHEVSIKPKLLKRFLRWIAKNTSDQNIYVSKYLEKNEGFPEIEEATVYNALSIYFKSKADNYLKNRKNNAQFTVLMLCSLKDYKGVKEFVKIAKQLSDIKFELVVNASQSAVKVYFDSIEIPNNLAIFSSQSDVHKFYQKAHLVVNLSHPEQWIETFGMTLLEGMYYGLPCIAPPVGGPAEIVEHRKDGFLIDQRNLNKIVDCIRNLQQDKNLYRFVSENAKRKSQQFNYVNMVTQIHELL